MMQMPTLGLFIQHATGNHGAQLETIVSHGPRGVVVHRYLVCGERTAVLPLLLRDDERLHPDLLRSLCNRLGLPPEDFGLLSLGVPVDS